MVGVNLPTVWKLRKRFHEGKPYAKIKKQQKSLQNRKYLLQLKFFVHVWVRMSIIKVTFTKIQPKYHYTCLYHFRENVYYIYLNSFLLAVRTTWLMTSSLKLKMFAYECYPKTRWGHQIFKFWNFEDCFFFLI